MTCFCLFLFVLFFSQLQAQVSVNFAGEHGADPSKVIMTFDVKSGSVSYKNFSNQTAAGFYKNPTALGDFSNSDATGSFDLILKPIGGMKTNAFDPLTWSGINDTENSVIMTVPHGWGVRDRKELDRSPIAAGEAMIVEFDLSNLKLPPGQQVVLVNMGVVSKQYSDYELQLHHQATSGAGVHIADLSSNIVPLNRAVRNGDIFALSKKPGPKKGGVLTGVTLDIIPMQGKTSE